MRHIGGFWLLAGSLAGALATLTTAPLLGMEFLTPQVALQPQRFPLEYDIFWRLRVPRALLAFLTGGVLALCGMVYQAMFRNALATPYTLGVSSGASLGAAIYLSSGLPFVILGISGLSVCAFVGSLFSISLIYGMTRSRQGFSSSTMLLAGVSLGFFFSSLLLFLKFFSGFTGSFRIVRWLMGGLQTVGMNALLQLAPFVLVGLITVAFYARELNLLAVGEDFAVSRGVHLKRTKKMLFFATSLMVGGVVSICGPIGFVGMIAPHICRLVAGPDHRVLWLVSFCFGGAFLTLCDVLSRVLIAPLEIPVGIITALLGGPFFLWLLLRRNNPGVDLGG